MGLGECASAMRDRARSAAGCAILVMLTLLVCAPAWSQPTGETCRVGINIEQLYDLDVARDTFGAVLWLWSLCPSRQSAPLATIALPTATDLSLGELHGSLVDGARYYQYQRVQGTFRHDWNMRHFPFDRQHLVIPIDETELGSAVVVFEPDLESSFLSAGIRAEHEEWDISAPLLEASITKDGSTYGVPDAEDVGYFRLEAKLTLERTQILTFFKLTAGVFAAALIGLLSLFLDPRDRGAFASKLGILAGVLFGVLLSMRAGDALIGDETRLTLVSEIHLAALVLIAAIALNALIDRRRAERGGTVRYPDWPVIAATAGCYVAVNLALVARAAWH